MSQIDQLLNLAKTVRLNAYAPYSDYQVGCAIRSGDHYFSGCNVENVSFGATICAERSAISAMIAAGVRKIDEVLVLTKDGSPPCGICLQVLGEFSSAETLVHLANEGGELDSLKMSDLVPRSFQSSEVSANKKRLDS